MKSFTIIVWFRYVVNGEQEKDFQTFTIDALGVHDAFNRIKKQFFQGFSRIPFSYEYMGNHYKPYFVDKNDEAFDLPLKDLNKEY